MLDLIRANAQSWGVKIAFGIIILDRKSVV